MKISELNPYALTDEQITQLLFKNIKDDKQKGDCILVLGSKEARKYRLPKAIQLYKAGRAKKILFSGGALWKGESDPEAVLLKKKAIEQGIPEQDILVEKISLNTKENILASLLVLDRTFQLHNVKRLIVVTANYHMRRTDLTIKTYMPGWIQFSLCPAQDQLTNRNTWSYTEAGRKRVVEEAVKIIKYVRWGALVDEEI